MKKHRPFAINLALQGGGSHGAFTWGVLDFLLEDGRWSFDGISGTSAGAMNAVVLAHGFVQAAQQHDDPDKAYTAGCEQARAALRQFWEGVGTLGSLMWGVPQGSANPWLGVMSQWLSPYQTNPLDLNPLRQLVERIVDFESLAVASEPWGRTAIPHLFICATNVRTGKAEIFSGKRIHADAVMASACLPMVFQAVEIDGQSYWDGGYSGNPALFPLTYETQACDTLLVQINPIEHSSTPGTAAEIMDRMNEVTFNAGLLSELRAIEFVRRLLQDGKLDPARYKNVRMHRIDGGTALEAFGANTKMQADSTMLNQLFKLGRSTAQQWLQENASSVGKKATLKWVEQSK